MKYKEKPFTSQFTLLNNLKTKLLVNITGNRLQKSTFYALSAQLHVEIFFSLMQTNYFLMLNVYNNSYLGSFKNKIPFNITGQFLRTVIAP